MRVFLLLLTVFLASSYALLEPGFFHVHDYTHAARIAEMARGLDAGQLPVRWSDNFGYGFGMPLFNFYAPLPYFVGALFWKIGLPIVLSIKALYLLTNLLTVLGSFLLGKRLYGRFAGVMLAAVYTLAPYRALNLFVRGALSEALAMAFFPWVLWAIVAFVQSQQRRYLLYLTLSLTAIMLSHNLSALIFVPMAALFAAFISYQQQQLRVLPRIAGYFLLAAGLSAFYMLPAVLEKDYTIISNIFAGYFHYSHHFLYIRQFFTDNWAYGGSAWGPDDDISFFLGYAGLGALLLTFAWSLGQFLKLRQNWLRANQKNLLFLSLLLLMLAGSLFLSIFKSQWLWDQLKLLHFIQFPWRFLAAASLWLAVAAATLLYLFPVRRHRWLVGAVILLASFYQLQYFRPAAYLDDAEALYYTDPQRIQVEMSSVLPDYIPKQMASEDKLLELGQQLPLAWLTGENTKYNVEILFDRGFEKLLQVESQAPELLNLRLAYFPGWRAEVDGQVVPVTYDAELGNLQIPIPAGTHQVGVFFGEYTWPRQLGNGLTLLSLLTLLGGHAFGAAGNGKKPTQTLRRPAS